MRNSERTSVRPTTLGALGQHDLDHADLLRPVGEVGAAERQQLQPELARQLLGVGVGDEQVDQQHVAAAQSRGGDRPHDFGREPALALDRQQVARPIVSRRRSSSSVRPPAASRP